MKDAVLVLKADAVDVVKLELVKEKGKWKMGVAGETMTDKGKKVGLDFGLVEDVDPALLEKLLEYSLPVLRRANGMGD